MPAAEARDPDFEELAEIAAEMLANPTARELLGMEGVGGAIVSASGRLVWSNRHAQREWGAPPVEIGAAVSESEVLAQNADFAGRLAHHRALCVREGRSVQTVEELRMPNGRVLELLFTMRPVSGRDGRPIGVLEAARDISRFKRGKAWLTERQLMRHAFLDHGVTCLMLLDADRCVVDANAACTRAGLERVALIGAPIAQVGETVGLKGPLGDLGASLDEAGRTGKPVSWTERLPPGRPFEAADVTVSAIGADDARFYLLELTDQTDRQRVVTELERSRAQLESAAAINRLGTFNVDLATGVTHYDERAERILGIDGLDASPAEKSAHVTARIHPDDIRKTEPPKADVQKAYEQRELRLLDDQAEGGVRSLVFSAATQYDEHGERVGYTGTVHDVTAARLAEEARTTLQKREAIATLVGAIAHDFNNLLGAITTLASVGRAEIAAGSDPTETFAQISAAADRAAGVVRQIIGVGREVTAVDAEPVPIAPVFEDVAATLHSYVGQQIEMRWSIEPGLAHVRIDASELHQILVNLILNSAQAIGEQPGAIEVSAQSARIGSEGDGSWALGEGDYVLVRVEDDGPGIPDGIAHRIFDPYFTTKPRGEGSGLGLASIQGIVRRHGGAVRATNAATGGAIFSVMLPAQGAPGGESSEADDRPGAGADAAGDDARTSPADATRVLVVDDEPSLLRLAELTLGSLGFDIATADGSHAALQVLSDPRVSVDALVTDLAMPDLDGLALIRRARAIRPGLPVVLCTGYVDDVTRETAQLSGVHEVLQKPVMAERLAAAIRGALTSAAT